MRSADAVADAADGDASGSASPSSSSGGGALPDPPPLPLVWQAEAPEAVNALALTPQGRLLAVATFDDAILVLNAADGSQRHRLAGHAGGTNALAFLGGSRLASAGDDGAARVWNVARGAAAHEMAPPAAGADRAPTGASVGLLAAAPDGRLAVAAGRCVTEYTFFGGAGAPPAARTFRELPSLALALRYNAAGHLAAAYNGGVHVWVHGAAGDGDGDEGVLELPFSGALLSVTVRPGGFEWVAAGAHDGSTHIFRVVERPSGEGVDVADFTCGGAGGKTVAVDFGGPRGAFLATAGGPRGLVWEFDPEPAGTVPIMTLGHDDDAPIAAQAWQLDGGPLLATGGRDGRVLVHDVRAALPGEPRLSLPAAASDCGGDAVTALAWGRGGALFSGHASGAVRAWDAAGAAQAQAAAGGGRQP